MKFFRSKKKKPESESADSVPLAEAVWQPFDHVLQNSQKNPSGLAIISDRGELTNGELFQRAKKIAQVFREEGIRPGQVVAAAELDGVDQFIVMVALFHEAAIGCVAPKTEQQPSYIDWLITTNPQLGHAERTRVIHWTEELESRAFNASSVLDQKNYDDWDAPVRLLFSSGTTGEPKAIPMSLRALLDTVNRTKAHTMIPAPFFTAVHLSGLSGFVTAVANLSEGQPYFVPSTSAWAVELMCQQGVKSLKGSPSQLLGIMRQSKESGRRPNDLESIQSTGALVSQSLALELESYFGAQVVNRFGSTEAGALTHGTQFRLDPTDIGEPHPGVSVEIVDEQDRPVAQGTTGRIRWKTPVQAHEYFANPTETKKHFRDGWFYSGDLGFLSADGHVHLVGRESEVFNIGGAKHNPDLLDGFAADFPEVRDAATFVITNKDGIEQLGIALVATSKLDRDGYLRHFFQASRGLKPAAVLPVTSIPRTELGKVRRAELAAEAQSKLK